MPIITSLPRRLGIALLLSAALMTQAQAAAVPGQGTWEASLQARDLDGNLGNGPEAYYDTAQNITWLADAFQARTSRYQARPWYAPGDSLLWPHAMEWAANLTLYGITDWRLPASFDTDAPGCVYRVAGVECGPNPSPASSELAYMFYVTLGNISYAVQPSGGGLTNTGPFSNLLPGHSWSETEFDSNKAWNFNLLFGSQDLDAKTVQGSTAWAVLDGDRGTPMNATTVPEPSAAALAALGLIALFGRGRQQRRTGRNPA